MKLGTIWFCSKKKKVGVGGNLIFCILTNNVSSTCFIFPTNGWEVLSHWNCNLHLHFGHRGWLSVFFMFVLTLAFPVGNAFVLLSLTPSPIGLLTGHSMLLLRSQERLFLVMIIDDICANLFLGLLFCSLVSFTRTTLSWSHQVMPSDCVLLLQYCAGCSESRPFFSGVYAAISSCPLQVIF